MTNFVHEEYLLTHVALGFNNEPLTNLTLVEVKVTIYDAANAVVAGVNDQVMSWNPVPTWTVKVGAASVSGTGWWEFLWNTTGMTAGTYRAKVTLTGTTGGKNFEYLRIRLARDPLPV